MPVETSRGCSPLLRASPCQPRLLLNPSCRFLARWRVPIIWGVLVAAGLRCRHRPDVHKRLMLVALVYLVDVPLLHLMGVLVSWWPDLQAAGLIGSRVVFLAVLSASAINDKLSRGRVHPVSLWVPLFLVVWEFALLPLAISTDAWRKFALWLFL